MFGEVYKRMQEWLRTNKINVHAIFRKERVFTGMQTPFAARHYLFKLTKHVSFTCSACAIVSYWIHRELD